MNKSKLKKLILSFTQDIIFSYNNKEYCINPFNVKKFEIGTQNNVFEFSSIEELMSAKIIDGKCLNDISENLIIY